MPTISSPGLGSGLDINGIIQKLMSVEQLPLQKLVTSEASYQAKISALGSLQGAVSGLDTTLTSITASANSTPTITATLGNTAIGLVTAGSDAVAGSHTLSVSQLAQAHKIASTANGQKIASALVYTGANQTINTGTLTVTVGGTSRDIAIGSSNATLTGLKNAINSANIGATADIVPQVGGGVRLVLTSATVGSTGKITLAGHPDFTYDPGTDAGAFSENPAVGGKPAAGYNAATDTIPQGTLTIKVGTGTARNVVIDSSNNTLAGLKDAINNAQAGVTASLVTKSSTDVRLVLTANETGASNTIVTSGLAGFDYNGGTGSLSQASANGGQSALDALLTVDGNPITSASNTVTSAITGITLRLAQTTTSATTLTVAKTTGTLAQAASSKFRSFKASVADSSIASATASTGATAGSYALEVTQLATAHRITTPSVQTHQLTTASPMAQQLRSTAVTTTADLTDGANPASLDIAIGGAAAQTISLAAGATITDLKDAINNANAGVTASLVAEGSTSRLVLTSNTASDGGKITVSNLANISGFDYDAGTNTGSLTQTQAAQGYSSSADTVAAGTLAISINGGTATNVTLTAPQNTLSDLKDAINAANAGVTAAIVTDGVGVRLQVTSNTVGAVGAVSLSGLAGFEYNGTTKSLTQSQAGQGYTSASQTIATGTLKLAVGSGASRDIVITSANNTLTGLKDAINAANAGVTASIVATGSSDVRLVIASATTGQAGRINLSGLTGFSFDATTGAGTLSQNSADGGQAAQSAIAKLNGVAITSDSNTLTDALQGVTLTLSKTTTTATTLTVSQDKTSTLSASFTAMVKAYNELAKSVADLGKYDPKTKKGGPLLGNATLRSVSGSIEKAFQNTSIQVNGRTLRTSDMGLEVQRDGTVSFNSSKLSTLAGSDYDSLALLAASMGNALKQVTSGALGNKGMITAATNGLNASVTDIGKRRETLARRLSDVEARYRQQFTALDKSISSMNSTSAYLTQQLKSLSAASSSQS